MLVPAGWFEAQPGLRGTLQALGVGVRRDQLIHIPIVAFLIEHPSVGAILVDTGYHRVIAAGSARERNHNLGPLGYLLGRNIRMRPEQTVAAQLRARGIEPAEIRLIVMTHMHFDHASALADFPDATVVVARGVACGARTRIDAARLPDRPAGPATDLPHDRLFDAPRAGPGRTDRSSTHSISSATARWCCLDTPGHSAGHLSILARLSEREALIAGDAIYTLATLREDRRPWRAEDSKAFERSLRALQAYDREHPDALIVPGHDMAYWETLAERYD